LLHRIWQDKHKLPHEIYTLDRRYKNFIYASEMVVIDEEEKAERERQKGGK